MIVKSLEHLNSLSRKIADKLAKNDCIFLIGEIGVGKTTFTRYLINYLQKKSGEKITEVLSPTFNLLYEYDLKNIKTGIKTVGAIGPNGNSYYHLLKILEVLIQG